MKTREEIITSMCFTYRHDFGLVVDNEEAMYTLSGITANQRQQIWNTMAQIYDNDIAPMLEEFRMVNEGQLITMPKSKEHAEAMLRVAQFFLDSHKEASDGQAGSGSN